VVDDPVVVAWFVSNVEGDIVVGAGGVAVGSKELVLEAVTGVLDSASSGSELLAVCVKVAAGGMNAKFDHRTTLLVALSGVVAALVIITSGDGELVADLAAGLVEVLVISGEGAVVEDNFIGIIVAAPRVELVSGEFELHVVGFDTDTDVGYCLIVLEGSERAAHAAVVHGESDLKILGDGILFSSPNSVRSGVTRAILESQNFSISVVWDGNLYGLVLATGGGTVCALFSAVDGGQRGNQTGEYGLHLC